ncbi:MAG TPA: class II aldolase/adducin family protein [Planctomycetota bacterium]|nr:class II aldolase/adducin family protein [Planctomycetota bacterium]
MSAPPLDPRELLPPPPTASPKPPPFPRPSSASRSAEDEEGRARTEIAAVCGKMYAKGLITSADGNVSVRLPDGDLLITPTGAGKDALDPARILRLAPDGTPRGAGRPSTELALHLCAYRERADVRAVVHAHPPTAVAFTIAGLSLALCTIPEVVVTLGTIPTASYGTPGTDELPESIRELVRCSDAILLERHGSVTLGGNLAQALTRLEVVEHTARITWMARTLGQVKELAPEQVSKLLEVRRELGIGGRNTICTNCGARPVCPHPDGVPYPLAR